MAKEVRAMSYGGGVQSTALLVLAAERKIDYQVALFSNVGDDSENPATIEFVNTIAVPFAEAHGIDLRILQKVRKNGTPDTLMQRIRRGTSTVPIPMRMSRSGAPGNRTCTAEFKVRVIAKELRRMGATKDNPALVALGISLDEYQRMRSDSGIPHEKLAYPLIDLRMDRQDCVNVIQKAGLPVPPKSSCFFCPYHSVAMWRDLLKNQPELFQKAVELERFMNERRSALGKHEVWMTGKLMPLDEVVKDDGQMDMFEPGCQIGGYCHA